MLSVPLPVRPVTMMHTDHRGADTQCRSCYDVHWPFINSSMDLVLTKQDSASLKWDTGPITTPE